MRAVLALLLVLSVGWSSPVSAGDPDRYWTPRSDAQLAADLKATCETAVAADKPVLVEFSAAWCGDCKRLRVLKTESPLKESMATVASLVVDVGRFDRHKDLLTAFKIGAIAYWRLTRPTDCSQPVTAWPVLASSTLEPAHGASGPRTAAEVSAWLEAAKGTSP